MSSIIRSTLRAFEPVAAFIRPAATQLSHFATRAFATGQAAAAPLIGRLAPLKAAMGSKFTIGSLALGTAAVLVYIVFKRPHHQEAVPTSTPSKPAQKPQAPVRHPHKLRQGYRQAAREFAKSAG